MEPIKTFPATEKIRWINSFASKTRVILRALKNLKSRVTGAVPIPSSLPA
jgi:hypothetical protein